ncbi:hypothetical protein SBF1_3460008 [Candidatus Desulfosporosinus infrequens]|uniref:Uncharacterized protein n=1 Tax=Candidatus Desulfosporosinus infrequens TaxID=2043169 RepID=A0A2U3L2K9_9FIRM|nr:hypothetical protein SBF1_3460008 [Candidatus Desulfosporosinus infrequens]
MVYNFVRQSIIESKMQMVSIRKWKRGLFNEFEVSENSLSHFIKHVAIKWVWS